MFAPTSFPAPPVWPAAAPPLAVVAVGAAGAVVGALARRRLASLRYRLVAERARPAPRTAWLPPTLGAVWAFLAARLWGQSAVVVLTYCVAAVWLAVLSAVDLDVHRLPDALTLPACVAAPTLLGLAGGVDLTGAFGRALAGGAALGGSYLAVYMLARHRGGFGLGDVKLAVPLGMVLAWVGWGALAAGTYAAFFVSGVTGVVALARGAGRHHAHAHGPAMALGALVGMGVGG